MYFTLLTVYFKSFSRPVGHSLESRPHLSLRIRQVNEFLSIVCFITKWENFPDSGWGRVQNGVKIFTIFFLPFSYETDTKNKNKNKTILCRSYLYDNFCFFGAFFFTESSVKITKSVIFRHPSCLRTVRQKKKEVIFPGANVLLWPAQ